MAEAGPVDSPWRRSSAWRELGLEAEAAAVKEALGAYGKRCADVIKACKRECK